MNGFEGRCDDIDRAGLRRSRMAGVYRVGTEVTAPALTPEVMAANVAKLAASPYGPGFHVAHGRNEGRWYRTACDCRLAREHPVGARGELAPVIPLQRPRG